MNEYISGQNNTGASTGTTSSAGKNSSGTTGSIRQLEEYVGKKVFSGNPESFDLHRKDRTNDQLQEDIMKWAGQLLDEYDQEMINNPDVTFTKLANAQAIRDAITGKD